MNSLIVVLTVLMNSLIGESGSLDMVTQSSIYVGILYVISLICVMLPEQHQTLLHPQTKRNIDSTSNRILFNISSLTPPTLHCQIQIGFYKRVILHFPCVSVFRSRNLHSSTKTLAPQPCWLPNQIVVVEFLLLHWCW